LIGSARTRIGYLVTPTTLLYGTGGFAWTQIDRNADSTTTSSFGGVTTTTGQSGSAPGWRAGWGAGLCVEQRIVASPWSGRLEYLHYDFGDNGTIVSSSTFAGVTTVANVLASGHVTVDELRAGVNYRFGAGSGGPRAQADEVAPAPADWSGF